MSNFRIRAGSLGGAASVFVLGGPEPQPNPQPEIEAVRPAAPPPPIAPTATAGDQAAVAVVPVLPDEPVAPEPDAGVQPTAHKRAQRRPRPKQPGPAAVPTSESSAAEPVASKKVKKDRGF